MAELEVRAVPVGWRYRLELYYRGDHIGEYEVSAVRGEHAEREAEAKRREAEDAAYLLLDAYRSHGKIAVRWNGAERRKEIRTYQDGQADPGRGGDVLALIPKSYWRKA